MIVAIDATPAMRRDPSGTEVYAREIIVALAADHRTHEVRLYANALTPPAWLPAGVEWRPIPFPRAWTHWRFRRALHADRPDVVFVPSHVLPVFMRVPGVPTIHDVGHRRARSAYRPHEWWYLELMTRSMARRARHLIAVSQSTADDLRRYYGVPAGRVTVVHSGVGAEMHPPPVAEIARVRRTYGLPDAYFLYVGRNHPRKNLPLLVRAYADARRRGLTASLVLAGPGHRAGREDGVQTLSYVPAGDLPALYAGALALTLPSRFEGFGFPVLEAMRCGTAVLASSVGALPEIAGPAGVLLQPGDPLAWSDAMLDLAGDAELQRALIRKGLDWSAQFTWQAAAAGVWRVLERAAAG